MPPEVAVKRKHPQEEDSTTIKIKTTYQWTEEAIKTFQQNLKETTFKEEGLEESWKELIENIKKSMVSRETNRTQRDSMPK